MFKGIQNGFQLIGSAIRIFKKYPVLLVPLVVVWIIIASMVIYSKWHYPWENYNRTGQFLSAYLIFLTASFLLTISSSILLELIEQNELGGKISFSNALKHTLVDNIGHIMVLSVVWSIIWFFLVILKALFSRKDDDDDDEKSAENIAKTLSGYESFSWFSLSIDMIIKGLRMVVFLILPAAAWEKMDLGGSFNRGFYVLRKRRKEFIGGFVLSLGSEFLLYLPPGIMFYLSEKGAEFSDTAWYICILYIGFAWSFSIYIEQMFAAELYLWHMKHEKEIEKAIQNKQQPPKFEEIQRPHILDEVPDMINMR